jgi:gliding motility-associated-like protein
VGLSCTDCFDPIASPLGTTTYCISSINAFGCYASDCVVITVDTLCKDLFIPNVFAPINGGHQENDCFRLYGTDCISSMSLSIYNRWGEKVFETSNKNECWDGNYRGETLNSGVFIYYLNADLITGESLNKQGNITLFR